MTALAFMRLRGFVRGGRALAPAIAALVVLGIIYGGGASQAGSAFGYSAVLLFPVLAWQTKLLLDTEPDGQRRLARLAVGERREAVAGVFAAAAAGLLLCAVAMLAPWPFGAIRGPLPGSDQPSLLVGTTLGVLAHLLALLAALALGALASRAVTRSVRNGVIVLVLGAVLAVVLGLRGSVAPWLVPPVMAMARALAGDHAPGASDIVLIAVWAVLWCALAFAVYGLLRRRRS